MEKARGEVLANESAVGRGGVQSIAGQAFSTDDREIRGVERPDKRRETWLEMTSY